ncbi:UDP-N-acetylmuramoyl-tripeptide--D-alanyl-D-alanine ligase [Anaeropeptidivorans aminofermentans]|uniref:hypothetical protein n=1 Tax=Anaeropeptidivorans aminofermentans TaxID=2934315 RepID=UPI00202532DC|nr:hypothetical protein [Anaeropeptidivorans aminofermentans]MBE6012629.1 hypothetical protein [Lachnospiraceae bacterium]
MLKIGFAMGVEGYLTSDATEDILKEYFDEASYEIDLIGIREEEKEYDIIVLNHHKENIDILPFLNKMDPKGILLLNSDEKILQGLSVKRPVRLVTFGLNPKSSITASSIVENDYISMQCCIQRVIEDIGGNEIYPQEFTVNIYDRNMTIYDAMAAVSVVILSGVDIEKAGSLFNIGNH